MGTTDTGTRPAFEFDRTMFDAPRRAAYMAGIDEEQAERSDAINRLVDLAATVAGSEYAQLSLIDETQFVPAAHGLEYADHQQHSSRDDSLCSVTMLFGETLVVDDAASHAWVRDLPPVTSGAVGAYLGVPVVSESGVCVGAICVFDDHARSWSDTTTTALGELARLTAREVDLIRVTGSRADTVEALTEIVHDLAVIGGRIDDLDGVCSRQRQASTTDLGGDWVDCVDLDGDLAFTLGDSAGHGLGSVAVMSTLLSATRAYLLEDHAPSTLLARLDALLCDQRPGAMATAVHGRLDRRESTVTIASAGHLPPVLVRDGIASHISFAPGPPLGFGCDESSAPLECRIEVEPGDVLVLYSDGLVERRDEALDDGMTALRAAIEDIWRSTDDPDERIDRLIERAVPASDDDLCVLMVTV